MSKRIAVIGAGASGLLVSSLIKGGKITVFEKNDRVGKKLFATGNGRCNLLNEHFSKDGLYSSDNDTLKKILGENSYEEIINCFKSLGLFTRTDSEGRIYPLSNQSSSVLDILRLSAKENGAVFVLNTEVKDIKKDGDTFKIITENGKTDADIVIISTGGLASSSTNGYDILKSLGHTVTPLSPVLTKLKADKSFTAPLKGIRSKAKLSLYKNDTLLREESGEIQFADYGISGIAAMQISRFFEKGTRLLIDFAEEFSEEDIFENLKKSQKGEREVSDIFAGIIQRRIAEEIVKKTLSVNPKMKATNLSDEELKCLSEKIKAFPLEVFGTLGFDSAQVTRGGVPLSEINSKTMESKIQKGLYITGEALDVDGECGGYNLGWAWISALKAANSINGDTKDA